MTNKTKLLSPNHTVNVRQLHQFHELPITFEIHLIIDSIVIHRNYRYGTILEVNLGMNKLLEYENRIILRTRRRNDEANK